MAKRNGFPPPPALNLQGLFLRRADWSGAILRDANFSNTDFTNASFRRSNFVGARLTGTNLRGADLTDAVNLTLDQLAEAIIDEHTKLPANIDRNQLMARARAVSTEGATAAL